MSWPCTSLALARGEVVPALYLGNTMETVLMVKAQDVRTGELALPPCGLQYLGEWVLIGRHSRSGSGGMGPGKPGQWHKSRGLCLLQTEALGDVAGAVL